MVVHSSQYGWAFVAVALDLLAPDSSLLFNPEQLPQQYLPILTPPVD